MRRKPPPTTCFTIQCMETLCFIFCTINAGICVLSFLASAVMLIVALYIWYWNFRRGVKISSALENDFEGWAYAFFFLTVWGSVSTSITGLALFFAILLVFGMQDNNKRYIKLYLIFGVIVILVSVILTLSYFFWLASERVDSTRNVVIAFGILFVYSGILLLIYKTYLSPERWHNASGRSINPSNNQESYGSN